MRLNTTLLTTFLLSIYAFGVSHAQAKTFDFSYQLGDQNLGILASGVLTTSDTEVNGAYAITGITGTWTFFDTEDTDYPSSTQQITGLLSPDTAYGAHNLLYSDSPYLDDWGFTYTLAGGYGGDDWNGDVNISYFNGSYHEPLEIPFDSTSFTLTPVSDTPEPGSLALTGSAMAIALITSQRRARRLVFYAGLQSLRSWL